MSTQDPTLDLRKYGLTLARHWLLICGLTIAFGLAGFVNSQVLRRVSPVYDAHAFILISQPRYQIDFEPKLRTTTEDLRHSSRLQTVATLARSPDVEAAVQRRLADSLPQHLTRPEGLVSAIRIRPTFDLLEIEVVAEDPNLAATIANAWAEETVKLVGTIYTAAADLSVFDEEVTRARSLYENAERDLIQFSIQNPVEDLANRVRVKDDELKSLREQGIAYLRTKASGLYTSLSNLDQLVRDAETLQTQMRQDSRSGPSASADDLALILLRIRLYLPQAGSSQVAVGRNGDEASSQARLATPLSPPVNVQLPAGSAPSGAAAMRDRAVDLDALIEAARARRTELQAEFDELARAIESDPSTAADSRDDRQLAMAMSRATADLARLRAQLAEMQGAQAELTRRRDVLQNSYGALLNKAQELRVSRATSGPEASVVQLAVAPRSPRSTPLRDAGLGAVVGFLLGTLLAFWREFRSKPRSKGPERRQAAVPSGDLLPTPAATVKQ